MITKSEKGWVRKFALLPVHDRNTGATIWLQHYWSLVGYVVDRICVHDHPTDCRPGYYWRCPLLTSEESER